MLRPAPWTMKMTFDMILVILFDIFEGEVTRTLFNIMNY